MEKSIKDELARKAEKAFKEKKISENELDSLKIVIESILKDASDDTPEININFAFDLYLILMKLQNLFEKQENYQDPESFYDLSKLVLNFYFEASDNYQKITDFEDRFCDSVILILYLLLIDNAIRLDLSNNIDMEILEKMKIDARDIYEKLRVSKNLRKRPDLYLNVLLNISIEELNHSNESLEATLKEGKRVINNLEDLSADELEEFTERFVVNLTKKKEALEDSDRRKLLNRWLQIFIENNLVDKTKLEVLRDILKKYENNDAITKKISIIYNNIQEIKLLLVVDDFQNLKFGHYTSGEVLQILLDQNENILNDKPYKITGKTRLYNVAYMNDPEEGKLLDILFGFNKSFSLENKVASSPWFLMSLTNAIDKLTMWSQYGNNAEGVCLELKPDSFLEVKSLGELEWLTSEAFESNITQNGYESDKEDTSNTKDCLYRICYLDEESLKNCELKIIEEDNELLKDKEGTTVEESRHFKIEGLLREIKEAISDALKAAPVEDELREDLNKLLEEIRYLFKSSAYKEEKELRILRYSELVPNNKKIKVHKVEPAAKLYIERDTEIELKSIIFGPKFKEPENVTPLVHLLDKDIICKRSSKKFK